MTTGGIALPEGATTGPELGEVIAVGDGKTEREGRIPMEVQPGDIVYLMFAYSKPMSVEIDGHRYIICTSSNLIGKKMDKAIIDRNIVSLN